MAEIVPPLTFPDAPRSELDRVITNLVTSAHDVLETQGRLRSLLDATRSVASELDLPTVLRRIVEAAVHLVGADYGAIGVISADGSLAQFIHVGMKDEDVARIGHLPEGHGLLGALIDDATPIRLDDLTSDSRSVGFPANHPPMHGFLGVPIRVRGEVFGNLYLSERETGTFTAEDQELLIALAATAGAAIDHARLFDESVRRQRWAAASADVTAALLSDTAEDSLAIFAERVVTLADADLVCIATQGEGTTLRIDVAKGTLAQTFEGETIDFRNTIAGRAYESGQPVLSEEIATSRVDPQLSIGPTMALPLATSSGITGVLTVSRLPERTPYTTADLDMAADFASQASVALELAAGRVDRQRLAILEDRSRIARDLHDNVIQRLFGAGMSLQALSGAIPDPSVRSLIAQQVQALDAAISEIRAAVFTLNAERSESPSLRHRVIDMLGEMENLFTVQPRVTFSGAVDLMIDNSLADDVIAVIREGLCNIARHARATHTLISVTVEAARVAVRLEDDGDGVPRTRSRSSGTANLATRASARGGTFALERRAPRGTVLLWDVPLSGKETA